MDIEEFFIDLLKDETIYCMLLDNTPTEIFQLHLSLGRYIRNKYLWNNPQVIIELRKHYYFGDIDTLSTLIIFELHKLINKK